MNRLLLICCGLFFCILPVTAQEAFVVVGEISIQGNDKTRDYIIRRELTLKTGDTLLSAELDGILQHNRNMVFNTRLFNQVRIQSVADTLPYRRVVNIRISVKEKWYLWPYPTLKFADRNFNIWFETRDLSRLNYGVTLMHNNLSGRADKLKLQVQAGYTRSLGLDYELPFFKKYPHSGLIGHLLYNSTREIWYRSEDNRLQFLFDPERRAIRQVSVMAGWLWRPGLYFRHQFELGAEEYLVSDSVINPAMNPEYLGNGLDRLISPRFLYTFKWDRRDIAYYTLKGHFLELNADYRYLAESRKHYLGLRANFEWFRPTGKNTFYGTGIRAKVSWPERQPYFLYQSLGYKFFVRGFEPYVVDGAHYLLWQNTWQVRLFSRDLLIPGLKTPRFNEAPTSLFFALNYDMGYVSSRGLFTTGNWLQNKYLSGVGVGLNLVSFYDRVFRFEYSFNNAGGNGWFIHFTAPI